MKKILILAALLFPLYLHGEYNPVLRASVSDAENAANGASSIAAITSDATGRYVVFVSSADNFTNSDNNGVSDIYLRDTVLGTTTLISRGISSGAASGASTNPSISADGRFIVFQSLADDLVSSDDNDLSDIFLYDRVLDSISIVSQGAFDDADGPSTSPKISADGLFVAFDSLATNFGVSDTNDLYDIYLYDVTADSISLVSKDTFMAPADGNSFNPDISGDGRYIVFESSAENINGSDNGLPDIFLYDRIADTTILASLDSTGSSTNGSSAGAAISLDGSIIAFQSTATDIVVEDSDLDTDIYAYDRTLGTTGLISQSTLGFKGNGASQGAVLSSDGRYVAFESTSSNLSNDADSNDASDIFIRDRVTGTTIRATVGTSGNQLNGGSFAPSLNGSAQFLAFVSEATDLVTDSNGFADVFVINQQCTLAPPGVVPADQDGDATDDCADDCPLDPAKIAGGACGCGVPDTNSDGDGRADCEDQCPSDPGKITPGDCGCGVADLDLNGNGQSDCLDVTPATVPAAPQVRVTKRDTYKRRRVNQILVRVIAPEGYIVDKYRFYLRRKGTLIAQKTSAIRSARFSIAKRNLTKGRYAASYDLAVPGTALFTPESPTKKFTVE